MDLVLECFLDAKRSKTNDRTCCNYWSSSNRNTTECASESHISNNSRNTSAECSSRTCEASGLSS